MSTCAKRFVVQVGDRPARVERAALAVQSNARQMTPRVLPATGGTGRPTGSQMFGRPLNHSALGGMDPFSGLARAISEAFNSPQGPVGHSGGQNQSSARGNAGGNAGGQASGGGTTPSGTLVNGRMIILAWGAPYTEPMSILRPAGFRIAAIMAARIISPSEPARYFRSGVGCDFEDLGEPARISIRSVDGMTIGDPTVLQWTFVYFGA